MRLIQPNYHPPNIVVFTAASAADAAQKTDAAIKSTPEIQGALWHRPEFNKQATHFGQYFNIPSNQPQNGQLLNYFGEVVNQSTVEFTNSPPPQLEELLIEEAVSFSKKTPSVKVSLCCATGTFAGTPHIEAIFTSTGPVSASQIEVDKTKLFSGYPVRTIQTINGVGTEIFDPSEMDPETYQELLYGYPVEKSDFPEPWTTSTGDNLFVIPKVWDAKKALIHCAPETKAENEHDARITRVTDLNFPN